MLKLALESWLWPTVQSPVFIRSANADGNLWFYGFIIRFAWSYVSHPYIFKTCHIRFRNYILTIIYGVSRFHYSSIHCDHVPSSITRILLKSSCNPLISLTVLLSCYYEFWLVAFNAWKVGVTYGVVVTCFLFRYPQDYRLDSYIISNITIFIYCT